MCSERGKRRAGERPAAPPWAAEELYDTDVRKGRARAARATAAPASADGDANLAVSAHRRASRPAPGFSGRGGRFFRIYVFERVLE